MEEIWKDIEGYEGIYQVSNLGRVRSLDRLVPAVCALSKGNQVVNYLRKGKILADYWAGPKGSEYKCVMLSKHDKPKNSRVHRLVACAFVQNPNNLPEVNHIDEDKSNNRADNLEWVTRIQNEHHGTKIERAARTRDRKAVEALDEHGNMVGTYDCIADAAKALGISISTIWQVCNKIRNCKTAGGYRWRYAEE